MTSWGCDHERTAREAYFKVTASKHSSFSINDAGLFINPDTPFIGATPDGLVHCDCCGDGVLEVKCPYSKKDVPMETACADPSFYLSTSDQVNNQGKPFSWKVTQTQTMTRPKKT
ncbi:uncharacterized protein LOC117296930 [Asterias rubens]|uniref:uncharacterized protein LOC117296930 n=1 Tax=Asterias rubens TaxID=7604 RepID=UPI001455A165|nr:uncharacterized protein LOC117296930 [Asterias rubens]